MKKSKILLFSIITLITTAIGYELFLQYERRSKERAKEEAQIKQQAEQDSIVVANQRLQKQREINDSISNQQVIIANEQALIKQANEETEARKQYDREHQDDLFILLLNTIIAKHNEEENSHDDKLHYYVSPFKHIGEIGDIKITPNSDRQNIENDIQKKIFNIKEVDFTFEEDALFYQFVPNLNKSVKINRNALVISLKKTPPPPSVTMFNYKPTEKELRLVAQLFVFSSSHCNEILNVLRRYQRYANNPKEENMIFRDIEHIEMPQSPTDI